MGWWQQLFNVVKPDLWAQSWYCSLWWPRQREGTALCGQEGSKVSCVQEHWHLPGHQGLKSNTNWPRYLEKIWFPEVTRRVRLYLPMTALAGLDIVKLMAAESLGPWAALQPLPPASDRLNTALVRWDSEGDGPARKKESLVSIPEWFQHYPHTWNWAYWGGGSTENTGRKITSLNRIRRELPAIKITALWEHGSVTNFSDKSQALPILPRSVEVQGDSEGLSSPHSQLSVGISVSVVVGCVHWWLPADVCWGQVYKTQEKSWRSNWHEVICCLVAWWGY